MYVAFTIIDKQNIISLQKLTKVKQCLVNALLLDNDDKWPGLILTNVWIKIPFISKGKQFAMYVAIDHNNW